MKNREDVLRVFLYAARDEKVRRLMSQDKSHEEASELVDTIDRERAAFIKKYFHLPWPDRSLYHAMLNTAMGYESVVGTILNFVHTPAHVIRGRSSIRGSMMPRNSPWQRQRTLATSKIHLT